MKYLLSIMFTFSAFNVCADDIFPVGCKAVVVKDESVTLTAPKSAVVMIHNLATHELWLTHPVVDPSSSAGWTSRLQGGNWSALALHDKSFELSCIESRPGHEQQISCAGVLAVCQFGTETMPANEAATYWAGEDMNLSALTAYIARRGFTLPALAQ